MGLLRLAIAVGLIAEGLLAATAYPRFEFVPAILATLAGWAIGSCGLLLMAQDQGKWVGRLLVVAAATWLLRGLALSDVEALAALGNLLAWTFAAAVMTATFASPGFAPTRVTQLVGLLTTAGSLVPGGLAPTLIGLVGLVSVATLELNALRANSIHTARIVPLACAVGFSGVLLAVPFLARLTVGDGLVDTRRVLEIATVSVAVALTLDLLRRAQMRSELTDLALDLATPGRFDAERRMAAAVGDAGIRIGFWNAAAERYEDSAGRSVEVERAGRGANVTYVGGGDQPRAVMIGSQAALADAWAQAALSRAVTLLTRNSELRALVQEQIAEVDSSRRRIAEAADEERRGLRVELQESLLPRVAALEAELARLDSGAGTTSLGSTREQLRAVQADLLAIADGLAPGGFAGSRGIADALAALAAKSPVSTVLDAAVAHEPGRNLAACLYFVASEGLTNAERHANATRIHIRLAIADRVRLEISDDGQGGAETRPGHGLDGLRERVSAMGGELKMVSPVLGGTTLVADLPLGALVDLGPDSIEEDVDLEGIERG